MYEHKMLKKSCTEQFLAGFFDNMKDKKKIDILLKVIERLYTKNHGMQKLIDESMIDICRKEGASPEQLFFVFLCC